MVVIGYGITRFLDMVLRFINTLVIALAGLIISILAIVALGSVFLNLFGVLESLSTDMFVIKCITVAIILFVGCFILGAIQNLFHFISHKFYLSCTNDLKRYRAVVAIDTAFRNIEKEFKKGFSYKKTK